MVKASIGPKLHLKTTLSNLNYPFMHGCLNLLYKSEVVYLTSYQRKNLLNKS